MRWRVDEVIVSFLALIVLGIGLSVFWVAWWLVADLFSGSHAQPARIIPATNQWRRAAPPSPKRTAISD